MSGRRLLALLAVLAVLAVPAVVLRLLCVGNACDRTIEADTRVPFCSLPEDLRTDLEHGFREGRSPDVLAVSAGTTLWSPSGGTDLRAPWPGAEPVSTAVPLVFWGAGVPEGPSEIPSGTTLDRVAPTAAGIVGLDRPFPEVRSGEPLGGFERGVAPRLVLLVAWKGVGTAELDARPDAWPSLAELLADGAGTTAAAAGSWPLDPAATLTTLGTGGLPFQHGVTGSWIRGDDGMLVPAFGPDAPVTVIATLADDLEEADPRTLVGLVATDEADRGLVGGGWYPDEDPTDVVLGDSAAAPLAVDVHLSSGYGADRATDVLGVVLEGSVHQMDRWTRTIVADARRATGHSVLVVVAGTGSSVSGRLAVPASRIVAEVEEAVPGGQPVVAQTVAGGLFLDQEVLTAQEITGQVVVDALLSAETPDGETMFADAFQGFAVSFARYC